MQIEHLAFNFDAAQDMVPWYVEHLGLPVRLERKGEIYCAFIGEGFSLLELYCNTAQPRLEPTSLDPTTIHLAFRSSDLRGDTARLVAAGARHLDGQADAAGYGLVMLRCPWGLPLQLCRRETALVA